MRSSPRVQRIIRPLVAHRFLLSTGLSLACGIFLKALLTIDRTDSLLRLMEMQRPQIVHALLIAYGLFLYSTPFKLASARDMLDQLEHVRSLCRRLQPANGADWQAQRERERFGKDLAGTYRSENPIENRRNT